MGVSHSSSSIRRLPLVVAATLGVLGVPIAAISLLRPSDAIVSVVPLVAVGAVLSVAASYAGASLWATRKGARDTVFGDLMIWGWLRRRRQERQVTSAVELLGLRASSGGRAAELSSSRRVRLLEQLAAGLEARYPDTNGHSGRVARHAAAIAKRMGLPREEVARIRAAAAVHDVGKIDTPAEIMNKPGALSAAEFDVIKRHAGTGARLVVGLGDEELTRIVRHHHERIDGGGYPDGLVGTAIPLGARIVAVADTFDAVTSSRPYRPAKRHREALAVLHAEAGTQLDADAVRAFRGYYSGVRPIALWGMLLNGSRQLVVSLAGQAKLGGVVAAATLGAVATGNAWVPQPGSGEAVPPPPAAGAVGDRLTASSGAAGRARSERAGRVRSEDGASARSGDGGRTRTGEFPSRRASAAPIESGEGASAPAEPNSGAGTGRSEKQLTNRPGPAEGGGGPAGGSGDGASRGGEGSNEDGGSGGGGSTARPVVSAATEPVATTVDTVVDTVESTTGANVTDPVTDVTSELPDAPSLGLGGK